MEERKCLALLSDWTTWQCHKFHTEQEVLNHSLQDAWIGHVILGVECHEVDCSDVQTNHWSLAGPVAGSAW